AAPAPVEAAPEAAAPRLTGEVVEARASPAAAAPVETASEPGGARRAGEAVEAGALAEQVGKASAEPEPEVAASVPADAAVPAWAAPEVGAVAPEVRCWRARRRRRGRRHERRCGIRLTGRGRHALLDRRRPVSDRLSVWLRGSRRETQLHLPPGVQQRQRL